MPAAVYRIDVVSYPEYEIAARRCLLSVSGLNPLSRESIVIRHANNVYYCPYSRLSQSLVDGRFGCAVPHIVWLWLWLCLRIGVMCQLKQCGGTQVSKLSCDVRKLYSNRDESSRLTKKVLDES